MTQLDGQYEHVRSALIDRGSDVADLEKFAEIILRISVDQHDSTFAEFHNRAGRFPFANDSDIGTLILERLAERSNSEALKWRLYREASWRATWCAQAATAGGEGLARSQDVERLTAKTKQAEQAMGLDAE